MTATLIDGKTFAAQLRQRIAHAVETAKHQGVTPGLAVILVGDDPASQVYVRNKKNACAEAGIASFETLFPAQVSQAELLAEIARLNCDPSVHGILVQLPLPRHVDSHAVLDAILPEKDVDGFHVVNAGKLFVGQPGLVPCTPLGTLLLLRHYSESLSGKHAVIVGRSNIVGKPMAQLLLRESCTVTVCHSKTHDLAAEIRRADIVVAAIGQPEFVQGDWIKPGAVVMDVGINRITRDDRSQLVGDVDFSAARNVAGAITPVPGGIGPMTIACLLRNTLQAACMIENIPFPLADAA